MNEINRMRFKLRARMQQMLKPIAAIVLLFVVVVSPIVKGQENAFVNGYFENPYLVNPAFSGALKSPAVYLIHQNALVQFPGSPNSQMITVNGRIKKENMGMGLKIRNEKINFINVFSGMLSYGYLASLNKKNKLSFGLSVGINNQSILFDRLIATSAEESVLLNIEDQAPTIDGEFGVGYHFDNKLVAGLSIQNLFGNNVVYQNDLGQSNLSFSRLRQYMLFGHYTFTTENEQLAVRPIVSIGSIEGFPFWYNIGTHVIFKGDYMLGVGYKVGTAASAMLGVKVNERFTFNYTFDYGVNNVVASNFTSHEVLLAYNFGSGFKGGGASSPSRSSKKSIKSDADQEQFEQLDMLEEKAEILRKDIAKQQEKFDSNAKEIRDLKESSKVYEEDIKKIIKENLSKIESIDQEKDSVHTEEGYFVVMGTFQTFANAKMHQQAIKRSVEGDPIIVQNKEKTYYYVCMSKFDKYKEALKELNKINKSPEYSKLIVGSKHSWLYLK